MPPQFDAQQMRGTEFNLKCLNATVRYRTTDECNPEALPEPERSK